MYFAISLDAPQPPPYPSIRLDPPRVDFHWGSPTIRASHVISGFESKPGPTPIATLNKMYQPGSIQDMAL
jgi:hypothetical protein